MGEATTEITRVLSAIEPGAQVVQLRFFGGLTEQETAELLGVTYKTIRRDWAAARVWLHAEMSE